MDIDKLVDERLKELNDWRSDRFKQIRKIVLKVDNNIVEEWKWSTLVWSLNGLICSVGSFKDKIKINFFHGAALNDKNKLFNAGLDSKKFKSIDLYEMDKIDENKLSELIKEAIEYNKDHK